MIGASKHICTYVVLHENTQNILILHTITNIMLITLHTDRMTEEWDGFSKHLQ